MEREDVYPSFSGSDRTDLRHQCHEHGSALYEHSPLGIVAKPLSEYGGRGVVRIEPNHLEGASQTLTEAFQAHPVLMLQEFLPAVYRGEVRCFGVGGSALAWCLKVLLPRVLANSYRQARFTAYQPSERDKHIAQTVFTAAQKEGLTVVGLDLIDGICRRSM